MDETAIIERIRARFPGPPAGEVWIGDDAAVLARPDGPLLLAADLVVAGVHADLELVGMADLGWKALVANVSDMAAMGGRPARTLVSVAAPAGTDIDLLYVGLAEAARDYACPVVGGDLANAEALVVSVAVTGTVPGGRPVLRSGASPGDVLWVTGPLGASAAGLTCLRADRRRHAEPGDVLASAAAAGAATGTSANAPAAPAARNAAAAAAAARSAAVMAHRRPRARVAEGQAAAGAGATAMIDVSDGLSLDLDRLAVASGVGVLLDEVPVATGATLADALGGGEDYELVFAARDSEAVRSCFAAAGLRAPLCIGTCTDDPSDRRLEGKRLHITGWQHDFGASGSLADPISPAAAPPSPIPTPQRPAQPV